MFITPHTSVALWIATRMTNPFIAFLVGIVSHFILDIIPHGDDEGLGEHKLTSYGKFIYRLKVGLVDAVLSVILVLYFVTKRPDIDREVLSSAVLGAWLPDLSWVAIETFKLKSLNFYIRFHSWLHNIFDWRYSLTYGVPFQIAVTLVFIKLAIF